MNLHLVLSICRICSENDSKLIRGFLAYFMWIRWMEDVCRDVGDSGEALGPAGSTSGLLKSPETRTSRSRLCHHSHLLFFLPSFLAPSREALRGCPSCQPGGSCPPAPSPSQWSLGRLSKTLRKKTELRLRASLQSKFFRVCLLLFLRLVWPLMQILFSSLFNNKWGFFGRFSRSGH